MGERLKWVSAALVVAYFAPVIIHLEFNPLEWPPSAREAGLFVISLALIVGSIIERMKDRK